MSTLVPQVLWRPAPQYAAASGIAAFARHVREQRGVQIADTDYPALHAWSVHDLEGFWSTAAEFLGIRFHDAPAAVLATEIMPGTRGSLARRSTTPSTHWAPGRAATTPTSRSSSSGKTDWTAPSGTPSCATW